MISIADYCSRDGRDLRIDHAAQWNDELLRNAGALVNRVSLLLHLFKVRYPGAWPRRLRCGWVPPAPNAPRTLWNDCQALSLWDEDRELERFLESALGRKWLRLNLLWWVDREETRGFVHLQMLPPAASSGPSLAAGAARADS